MNLAGPSSSNNDIVYHCYVHDSKTYGIGIGPGVNEQVLDNWVVNSWANGIILYAGGNDLVQGNTVVGVSDVGISVSGGNSGEGPISNVLVTQNFVENVNLHISPFGQNTGSGLYAGDNGQANNVVFSNNYVANGIYGIVSCPYSGSQSSITITGNTVNGFTSNGVVAYATSGLTITSNIFNEPASALSNGVPWWYDSATSSIVIQNNYVNGVLDS